MTGPAALFAASALLALTPAQSTEQPGASAAAPAPVLADIVGLGEAEARRRLGAPDLERAEGVGALWTYRLDDCALLVFLRRGSGDALKITGAETSPRRRGEARPELAVCLREAMARSGR